MSNTINWGKIHGLSYSPETNLTGTASTPSFTNTKSVSFDGIDDYVDCGDADNLSFGNGSTDSPFSISAWINMNSINKFRILSKYEAPNYEYQFDVGSSSKLELYIFDGTKYRARLFNTPLNTGQWYHVAATYSGVGGANAQDGIKIYVDGVRVDDTTDTNGTYVAMHNTTADVYIGQIASTFANGAMDEVAIFSSELSQSDITSIYNSGVPNDLSSLSPLSWWRMGDGDTFPTLTDNGSGGNDGTMTNMTSGNIITDVPT